MPQDWKRFGEELEAALAAPDSPQAVRDLVRQVLVSEPPQDHGGGQLVRRLGERLDVVEGDPTRMVALAKDLTKLLRGASSEDAISLLLEVVAERERFLGVLSKHMDGTISRTGLLSFIAKQRWPQAVKRRAEGVTAMDAQSLREALRSRDFRQLERLLAD